MSARNNQMNYPLSFLLRCHHAVLPGHDGEEHDEAADCQKPVEENMDAERNGGFGQDPPLLAKLVAKSTNSDKQLHRSL